MSESKNWFVVIRGKDGKLIPIMNPDNESLATFKTSWDAERACKLHPIVQEFGAEMFQFGSGDWI